MSLLGLFASFGGGVIGAYMGALPAFILVGVVAVAGSISAMSGGADYSAGFVAFGSYLGPHIAFAGGVAASAYAAKAKKTSSGTDIVSCLNGIGDPATLIVGGVFGVIGFLVCYLYGDVLHLNTDLPGMTVVTSAIIARLVFGSTGLFGKTPKGEKKEYFTAGKGMVCNILLGLGIGTATSCVYQSLVEAGADVAAANFPILCFGIAATSLIFAQTGFAMPGTHHIALISASAAVASGNPVIGIVFGILASLMGDFVGKTFNSNCDSHIDPPAFAIFTLSFVINILFGTGFFSA